MELAEVRKLARLVEDLADAGARCYSARLQYVAVFGSGRVRHLVLIRPGDRIAAGYLDRVRAEGEVTDIDGQFLTGRRGGGGFGGLLGSRRFRCLRGGGRSRRRGGIGGRRRGLLRLGAGFIVGEVDGDIRVRIGGLKDGNPVVAGAVDLLQTDEELAADDAAADVAAGDIDLDGLGALVNVDRVRGGEDVAQGKLDRGLTLLDQNGVRGAEDLARCQLGDISQGSDDVAQIVTGSGMNMRRVGRGVVLGLGGAGTHRERNDRECDHARDRCAQGGPTSRAGHGGLRSSPSSRVRASRFYQELRQKKAPLPAL